MRLNVVGLMLLICHIYATCFFGCKVIPRAPDGPDVPDSMKIYAKVYLVISWFTPLSLELALMTTLMEVFIVTPDKFLDEAKSQINLSYTIWYRQDKTILSALLNSCSDTIQPVMSSSPMAKHA
ncbi:unnamed protein product [Cuscuta epithymum]|nr:unnamed protein product [Cuscuta epithymum]